MKFTSIAVVAFAAVVSGQTLADIPSCAKTCLDDAVSKNTKCSTTDVPCICKSFEAIQGAATGCVLKECGQDVALNKVLPATQALCKNAGSDSSAPASSSAAATSAPASSAPASSAPASSAPTETGSASATESAPATTMVPTSAAPTNGTAAPTSTAITAGAAGFAPVGGLAMLALGALAL
ncbi:CFEM domain-containing protein [Purpureocillium lavendulum]|uniref:CFEM domain-containing protein n=1 Tax=Purpureocillium lavendulum TaxID=1247861 RepID=A0AB34FR91_9HYPO|nr:CFEM domain-containing protein [Purpureocillium lavendulum]